ncbi:MAG: hypothetical protein ACXQTW_02125 [Candidatus Methanospirareceae archaeon]
MEKEKVRDVVLIIVLLALGLFFAGLAGYFWENPGNNALSFISIAASATGIVSALLIVLKFVIVTPIIEEIGRTNRIILASAAASSTKTLEDFLDDFNMVSKALKEMEV